METKNPASAPAIEYRRARHERDYAAEHRRGIREPGVARERARHRRDHDEDQRKDLRHENDRAPNDKHSGSFALRECPARTITPRILRAVAPAGHGRARNASVISGAGNARLKQTRPCGRVQNFSARSERLCVYSCITLQGTSSGRPQLSTAWPRMPSNQTPRPA